MGNEIAIGATVLLVIVGLMVVINSLYRDTKELDAYREGWEAGYISRDNEKETQ